VLILQEDITARVTAEQKAREHQQLLARCQRIATIGETAAALAHEVNQPLTAVVSYCEGAITQLKTAAFDAAEVVEALADACREAERASAIVRGVNSFVRRSPDQRRQVDVNLLIGSVVELARKDLERHGVELCLELGEALPPVSVNAVEVEQVLFNLVRNSIDALVETGPASRRVSVRSALVDGQSIEISVDDSGHGFSAEARTHVFTPFFTTKPGGIGMGLAICRTIVESHGGRIWAEDSGEGGASVHFSLPLAERVRLAS
jgi:two-component system sensor histidine kinase TtrS